jgi:hypothetical protein
MTTGASRRGLILFAAWTIALALWLPQFSPAQSVPGTFQPQSQLQPPGQAPVVAPQIQFFSAPTSALPANVLTPLTTSQLAPGTGAVAPFGPPRPFGGAGRGLPGMPGGPPLKAPMGAQDPTDDYMRPPVIGPLFCDPAVNIPC